MKTKVEAFFEEFPFLSRYINKNEVNKVRVSRIDSDFLKKSNFEMIIVGFCEWRKLFGSLLLLNEEGNELTRIREIPRSLVGKLVSKFSSFIGWTDLIMEDVETALLRLKKDGNINKVFFAVEFLRENRELVLYKPPKGFTITAWIDKQIACQRDAIRQELTKIDQEGVSK